MTRVHFTGGPGSGKTTIAKQFAEALKLPLYDLDGLVLDAERRLGPDAAVVTAACAKEICSIAATEDWVSEGTYLYWTRPLFEAADTVVCMDVTWGDASRRILGRHLRAELTRSNRFPGWRSLYRFWRFSAGYYSGRNDDEPEELNAWGTPNTFTALRHFLEPYATKVIYCRTSTDIRRLMPQ